MRKSASAENASRKRSPMKSLEDLDADCRKVILV